MRIQINKFAREVSDGGNQQELLTRYCDNCDTELYGLWILSSASREKSLQEKAALSKMERCPVCGALLSENGSRIGAPNSLSSEVRRALGIDSQRTMYALMAGSASAVNLPGILDSEFQKMRRESEQRDSREAELLVNKFASGTCSDSVRNSQVAMPTERVAEIKASPAKLKEYLYTIIKTETDICTLSKRLTVLYTRRIQNGRVIRGAKNVPVARVKGELIAAEAQVISCREKYDNARNARAPEWKQELPRKPAEPVLEKPALFNGGSVRVRNDALMVRYQQELEDYHHEVARQQTQKAQMEREFQRKKNAAVQQAGTELSAAQTRLEELKATAGMRIQHTPVQTVAADVIRHMLDKEIHTVETLLKELHSCRNWLLSQNIVYIKYRDIATISVFYKYLMSGRCDCLEGPYGAYNLYESECRYNRIESRLEDISGSMERLEDSMEQMGESLKSIAHSQQILSRELKYANSSLDRLNDTMDAALDVMYNLEEDGMERNAYLKKLAHSSEVTAWNTQVIRNYAIYDATKDMVQRLM